MVMKPGARAGGGLSALHAKIKEFRPTLVVIDGLYLLKDDRAGGSRSVDWKAQHHVTQDARQTALEFNIPVIAITQAKRGAGKDGKEVDTEDIAYANAVGMDAEVVIYAKRRKFAGQWEQVLEFPAVRETPIDSFTVNYHPACNFSFKSSDIGPDDPVPQQHSNSPSIGGPKGNHSPAVIPQIGQPRR
jgi:hypothetical protein